MTATRRRIWPRALLALALLALVGEVAARVVDRVRGTDSSQAPERDPSLSLIVPHPYVGYVPRPSISEAPEGGTHSFTNNSMGFRGPELLMPKPPRTFRVGCIGGSTTQALASESDDETWPARLAARLAAALPPGGPYDRVDYVNAGAGGYTSIESFINLKTRLLPLDLDLVVDYDAANDAQLVLRAGFKPDYSHVRRSWTPPPARPLLDRLFGWSHLYGAFLDPKRRLAKVSTRDLLFVPDYDRLPLSQASELGPAYANFFWTMREIVSIARTHGVPTLLCTFAWPQTGPYAPTDLDLRTGYIGVVKQLNIAIRAASAVERVPLADLERAGPANSVQYCDPVHPNAAGYDLIAQRMAEVVLAEGWLSRPPPPREVPAAVFGRSR